MKYLFYITILVGLTACHVSMKMKSYGLKSNMNIHSAFVAKIDSILEINDKGIPIKYTISASYRFKSFERSSKKVYMFKDSNFNLWISANDTIHSLPTSFHEDGWYILSNGGSFGRSPFVWLCNKNGGKIRRYREEGIGTLIR